MKTKNVLAILLPACTWAAFYLSGSPWERGPDIAIIFILSVAVSVGAYTFPE